MAKSENSIFNVFYSIFRANKSEKGKEKSGSGINDYVTSLFDQALTWNDLKWLKKITSLPIIVKGVLHPSDALIAIDHGVQGIMVSNHGARQLDGVEATIDALPDIVEAVRNYNPKVEIYLDGGVREGTDVLKALALGAKMVRIKLGFVVEKRPRIDKRRTEN